MGTGFRSQTSTRAEALVFVGTPLAASLHGGLLYGDGVSGHNYPSRRSAPVGFPLAASLHGGTLRGSGSRSQLPEQALGSRGAPARCFAARRVPYGAGFQVSPFKLTRGRGHHVPYQLDRQPWAELLDSAGLSIGCRWLRPGWCVAPPDRRVPGSSSLHCAGPVDAWPDEGGLKTHRLCSVGSEGVCGWLADGYRYPKTFGGQPQSVPVGTPLAASLHGGGPM